MSFGGLQADLGGFDPRFLGITVRFSTHKEFERFRSPNYAFSTAAFETMKDAEAFRYLAEMTVLQHELRHFHDFLLSPYGQILFRLKLQAYFNGLQALGLIAEASRRTSVNCVPIPISRWTRLNADSRARQIERWNRGPKKAPGGGEWLPAALPFLPEIIEPFPERITNVSLTGEEGLVSTLGATIRAYDKIEDLLTNPESAAAPTPLQPWHLMEVSALLVQAQEIAKVTNNALAYRFLNMLEASGFPRAAVRLVKALEKLWLDRKLEPQLTDLVSVVAFCLMGSYAQDGWKACPTHRVGALTAHLRANGPPSRDEPVRQRFIAWSAATGLSEPVDAMKHQVQSNSELVQQYRAISSKGGRIAKRAYTALQGAEALYQASSAMLAEFMRDPESYLIPSRYLESAERFPQPSIRCEFDGWHLRVKRLNARFRKDWLVMFSQKDRHGTSFMRTGLLKAKWSSKAVMPHGAAAALYAELLAIDYAFQPSNRLDWEFGEVARPMFRKELRLTPLQITG